MRSGVLGKARCAQVAVPFQKAVDGGGNMPLDALEITNDVELQGAGLDLIGPAGTDFLEMPTSGLAFQVAKTLLLGDEAAGRPGHRRRYTRPGQV